MKPNIKWPLLTIIFMIMYVITHPEKKSICWKMDFNGIVLGISTYSHISRLIGEGIFKQNEGNTGGQYFIDLKMTASMHAIYGTDQIIVDLIIEKGINKTISKFDKEKLKSKWFNPYEGFGNWNALKLGSKKSEVMSNLGEPNKIKENEWRYDLSCTCELPEYFVLHFKDDKIYKIVFSAPHG